MIKKLLFLAVFSFFALTELFSATYTVTNNSDGVGAGAIRWALNQTFANPGHDTIVFADDFTIELTGNNRLFVLDPAGVTIDAGDKNIIIDGSKQTSSNAWPGVGVWLVDTGLLWGGGEMGANSTVKGLTFRNFTHIGLLVSGGSYNNNIIDCSFYDVDTSGLKIDGTDTDSTGNIKVENNSIENCTSYNNGTLGIEVVNSNENTITNSTCYGNAASGIAVTTSNSTEITNTTCYDNTANGIHLTSVDDTLIQGCTLYSNGTNGIHVITSQNTKISKSSIYDNTYNGILVVDSSNNAIGDSKILTNDNAGIWLINESHNNKIYRNRIGINQHNENRGNTWSGVLISGGASNNYVGGNNPDLGNIIAYNIGEGVKIDEKESKHNIVRFNTYFENQMGGFVVFNGANEGLPPAYLYPPHSLETQGNVSLYGIATPGATVDIYISDSQYDKTQGRYYKGSVVANSDGEFIFDFFYDHPGKLITALVHDTRRNSSGFALTYNGIGLNGTVVNSKTLKPVFEAEVLIYDKKGRIYAGATTDSQGKFSFPVTDGTYAIKIRKEGYAFPSKINNSLSAPAKGEYFRIRNDLDVTIPIDAGYPLGISILSSSDKITPGNPLKLKILIKNHSIETFSKTFLDLRLPEAFKMISSSFQITENNELANITPLKATSSLGSQNLSDSSISISGNNSNHLLALPQLNRDQELAITALVSISGGTETNELSMSAQAYRKQGPGNEILSFLKSKNFEIIKDAFLDNSTLIGKVFLDYNKNGIQDKGEDGIPHVTLITEQGILVTTDKHGRYSIPTLKKGSHLLSIKSDSLPTGSKSQVLSKMIYIREGSLHKLNFPVYSDKTLNLNIDNNFDIVVEENLNHPTPFVDTLIEKYDDVKFLQKNTAGGYNLKFNFLSNCKAAIQNINFTIMKENNHEIVFEKQFENPDIPAQIIAPIAFDAMSRLNHQPVSYFLDVTFLNGNKITTIPKTITISREGINTEPSLFLSKKRFLSPDFNNNEISLSTQGSIKASGKLLPTSEFILSCKKENTILFTELIYTDKEGAFNYEFLVPFGSYNISISQTINNGGDVLTENAVTLKETNLILAALAEAEIGKLNSQGNIEITGNEDDFDNKLYSDSKAAFFLKGKIKGKYLITISYDSQRDKESFFKYLDPDKYYPIYGDNSSIRYDGENSQGKFYLLVEWDQNKINYGNFKANFNENSLIYYSRTLHGAKIQLQSTELSSQGKRTYKILMFGSNPEAVRDIVRYKATGGSVYYLKKSDIIPGSENVTLEVRDAVTGMTLRKTVQKRDLDYDIDYDSGRIVFSSPVTQVASGGKLTNETIYSANPVYVVVSYEYKPDSIIHRNSGGLRAEKTIFDKISVGATLIAEENSDHEVSQIKGIDIVAMLTPNTKLTLEAAQTKRKQTEGIISENGGLSFDTESNNSDLSGDAYSAELISEKPGIISSRLFYEDRETGFYNPKDFSELGSKKYGAEFSILPLNKISFYSDFFYEEFKDQAIAREYKEKTQGRVGLSWKITTDLKCEMEYQGINKELTDASLDDDLELFAIGAFWDISSRLHAFIKHQWPLDGEEYETVSGGLGYKLFEKFRIGLTQDTGDQGDFTRFNAVFSPNDNREIYLSAGNEAGRDLLGKSSTLTFGVQELIDRNSSMYTEYRYQNTDGEDYATTATGYRKKLNDYTHIKFSLENNDPDPNNGKSMTAFSGITYSKPDKTYLGASFELHESKLDTEIEQVLSSAKMKHYFDNGLSLFLRTEYSITDNELKDSNEAYFKELSSGIAFRPVNFDKIHFLGKYTYLRENNPPSKESEMDLFSRKDRIASGEAIIDIFKGLQYFIKYATRKSFFEDKEFLQGEITSKVDLWIHRLGIYLSEKLGFAIEYRQKDFKELKEEKEGFLTEIFFDPVQNLRLTFGYNFTDFTDSLIPSNDYDYGGAYFRITGKAFFDDLKFFGPFKNEYYNWKPFLSLPDKITSLTKADLTIGVYEGDFEWNLSNANKWEYDWRYLYGEDKENTFDPGFYNRIETLLDIPVGEHFSQNITISIDPSMITSKKTVTALSDSGDHTEITFLYWPFEDKTIPLSVRSENGNAFLTGEQNVKDYRVDSYTILTNWGDTFTVPSFKLEKEIMPFKELSSKYQNEDTYIKINWLTDQFSASTLDDPLVLSGQKNFWQPHPWTYEWNPGAFYYGNMHAFEKGKFDDSLTYINRNSFAEFLTKLRGIQFGSYVEDIGRFEANIASPIFQWDVYDEYFKPNNINGTFRYKSSILSGAHSLQTGMTYAFRVGYNMEELDLSNQVLAWDFYFKTFFDIQTTLEYASSQTETDRTSNFRQDYSGNAYKIIFEKDADISNTANKFSLLYTVMEKNFAALGSDFRFTSLDQFWSRHITFHDYDQNFIDKVLPFKDGDGIRENRKVAQVKVHSLREDLFENYFSFMNVVSDENNELLENRFRDELSLFLHPEFILKLMLLHYHYPETKEGIEPLFGKTSVAKDLTPGALEKEVLNEYIEENKDPSISTYSLGFKWSLTDWLDLVGIYEYTNNWGDQFPQFIIQDTAYGNVDTNNSVRYDSPTTFLFDQNIFEQPAYDYYNIYRVKTIFHIIDEQLDLIASYTKNENKFAGGIDDNVNHTFLGLEYLSLNKKFKMRINHTHSKTYDIADYVNNNVLNYESHDNFFTEIRYELSNTSTIYAHYGIFGGMQENPVSPFVVVPWNLPVLDTRNIFKVTYSKKF